MITVCTWARLFGILLASVGLLRGADGTVLLIVNGNSSVSKAIGEYYSRKRDIPRSHTCVIRAPQQETISRAEYDLLEASVGRCLTSANLTETVLYLVTTLGVPLRVQGSHGLEGDNASVDSELSLLYSKLHGARPGVRGFVPNPLFNRPDATFKHPDVPIYLVTRLAAYDFAGVRGLIDRSLQARNRGRFVLDARSGRTDTGDDWLLEAAIALPSGRTVFDDTTQVLHDQKDVIGFASWGSNDSARKRRRLGFTWLPGAIMTEYVSTNARTFRLPPAAWELGTWKEQSTWFAGAPQSLIGDYIAEGVTGVAGHVDEPYLHLTPRPNLLLPAWYKGRKLAEAFYLAIPGLSWQNVVIGDPLCSLGPPKEQ
jgi:uncharacterized protein (TIGR03790 family)